MQDERAPVHGVPGTEAKVEKQLEPEDQAGTGERTENFRELFVRQVEDRGLPARQVLTDQHRVPEPDMPVRVYIP
jgi:hypothetical protein